MQKIEYKFLLDTMEKIILSQEKIIDNTYNFCLEKKDIINYKGFAVNKLTNKYITNIEYIPKSCPKITYLGTNIAENEGKRHYFLIKLDKPYKNLLEKDVNYLPVYISTGANTGNICKEKKCIIPFFGVTTSLQNNNITALLLKSDFIKAFKDTKNFNLVKNFYISENEDEDELKKKISNYFGEEFKVQKMIEYKKKVGSNFFINIIINNKKEILEIVNKIDKGEIPTKEIKYLHYLNYLIGENNFIGIRLQYYKKTRDIIKDISLIKNNEKRLSILESPLIDFIVNDMKKSQS